MIFDLASLFIKGKHNAASRDAARQAARKQIRKQHPGQPLTGAWYWFPEKHSRGRISWKIETFYDAWQPKSDHVYIWKHVLDLLEHRWNRKLPSVECYSLPRGRVSQLILSRKSPAKFAIYHGDDSPLGIAGLNQVRKAFQLPTDCRATFDEHERCIAGQPQALSHALGHDLKILGVEFSELDYSDE